jgi:small conductance mechanosensitive channel
MERLLDQAQTLLMELGPSVLAAIVIFVVGRWIAKIITKLVARVASKAKVDPILVKFMGSVTYAVLLMLVIISALGKLGINTTSFVAIVGAAGLAIGFAFQGTLGNLASGVMLILFRPFKTGDYIEAGGTAGTVEEVQIFATILRTPDNKRIIIPNGTVVGGNITNYSANPTRRVDMVFGIGYGDDLRKAKSLLETIVKEHPQVLADPAPTIAVSELADSSVNFVVRPWVNTADYWTVYFDITETVKLRLDQEGISIPFPQHDVHLFKEESSAA